MLTTPFDLKSVLYSLALTASALLLSAALPGLAHADEGAPDAFRFVQAVAVEAGVLAVEGGRFGGAGRVILPHSSVDLGLGVRLSQTKNLLSYGVGARGYWKEEGAGPYLGLGVSTSAINIEGETGSRTESLRLAPYIGAGYRATLIDDPIGVPISAGVSYYRREGRVSDGVADDTQSGFIFDLSIGLQFGWPES